MELSVITVILLMTGAVALAIIDQALGSDSGRFPCAHPSMKWALRLYALALFNRAAVLTAAIVHGSHAMITLDILLGSAAMCTAHVVLLTLLLRSRLPAGVWPRLERRLSAERRAASQR